jgi:hypothetical protein
MCKPIHLGEISNMLAGPPPFHDSSIPLESGLDYILSQFEEPVWPRNISSRLIEGAQVLVYDKHEALEHFKRANLFDCKISGYPEYTEWNGLNRTAPSLIFVDLDLSQFTSRLGLDRGLHRTLNNIREKFGSNTKPTVIWSGNGYHIYLPVLGFILELDSAFAEFHQPSRKFIQFAEKYLSNKKADPSHSKSLSFKNCMLRIPGSHNSKLLELSNSGEITTIPKEAEVKIIQDWNGIRPAIKPMLVDFFLYLQDAKGRDLREHKQAEEKRTKWLKSHPNLAGDRSKWPWVETLLQIPLEDFRKNVLRLIITPYLVNVRKLSYDEAFNIAKSWLNLSGSVRRLDFNSDRLLKENLKNVQKVGYLPIGFEKLREENRHLHSLIKQKMSNYFKASM